MEGVKTRPAATKTQKKKTNCSGASRTGALTSRLKKNFSTALPFSRANYLELESKGNYLELELGTNCLNLDSVAKYLELESGTNYLELESGKKYLE